MRQMTWGATLFGVLAPAGASAFCGLYVAEEGKTIENHASQVIWARYDGITTITIGADFTGDASSFGLLVPVPEGLGQDDVSVVEPAVFDELEAYTTPRLVSYSCADFATGGHQPGGCIGCRKSPEDTSASGSERGDLSDGAVDVEARFTAGEYEIAILNTADAGALSGWLGTNGFAAPTDRDGIVQGYIDNGARFMAARVLLDELPDGRQWLSPIQFSYASDVLGLPIRIGTLASTGQQEVVIYGITDADDGELHVGNFPQVTLEDECMWEPEADETLGQYYARRLDDAFAGQAGWLVEYSIPVIGQAACDPCTTDSPLFLSELPRYGWHDDAVDIDSGVTSGGAHLTRMRVRYTAEQATSDLQFAMAGPVDMSQIRFIQYVEELESRFPVCGLGLVDDPGTCDDGALANGGDGAVACATPPRVQAFGAVLGLGFALRRRRAS